MKYCVYIIKDIRNGRVVYIGKTSNFDRRKNEHLSLNSNIKSELSEIGVENVSVEPIEYFEDEVKALEKEDELILKFNTIEDGFNRQRSGFFKVKDIKAYNKEHNKAYYDEHREDILSYKKAYNDEHKENMKEYQKAYWEKHKDDIMARRKDYQKYYYENNKEYIKARQKAYYEKNIDDIKSKSKAYYEKNIDDIKSKSKAYYEKHKENMKEYQKAYREKHKEDIISYHKVYYLKHKGKGAIKKAVDKQEKKQPIIININIEHLNYTPLY